MLDKAHQETARIVLALDTAIAAFRAGEFTGLRALGSASRLMDDLADDAVSEHAARATGACRDARIVWNWRSSRRSPTPTAPKC
jgi:hypothetical protein